MSSLAAARGGPPAVGRIARLLVLSPLEARAVLRMAACGPAPLPELQAELELSAGGVVALVQRLEREAVVRRDQDGRLSLTPGAEREVEAALH
jgi:DNA-binding IclR family transcriptional regulator